MDNIQAKLKYIEGLRAQGFSEEQIERQLESFDQVEERSKQLHEEEMLSGRLSGDLELVTKDLQSFEANRKAVDALEVGTYDQDMNDDAPSITKIKLQELHESIKK